jgi:prepilin-type N-terminal cleavage/methylation domain-containing protein
MTRTANDGGMTLLELLVGLVLGLVGAAAMTALLRGGAAAWERAGARAEVATEVAGAIDQLTRDLRVAGYDPAAAGFDALPVTAADRLEVAADLDGDGVVDPDSEEHVGYRWSAASGSLLRIVGRQSLPLLSAVAPDGFRLAYRDADGADLDPADPGTGAAARVVTIELTTTAQGPRPGVRVCGGARLVNR